LAALPSGCIAVTLRDVRELSGGQTHDALATSAGIIFQDSRLAVGKQASAVAFR
jgi:hypothetical protein